MEVQLDGATGSQVEGAAADALGRWMAPVTQGYVTSATPRLTTAAARRLQPQAGPRRLVGAWAVGWSTPELPSVYGQRVFDQAMSIATDNATADIFARVLLASIVAQGVADEEARATFMLRSFSAPVMEDAANRPKLIGGELVRNFTTLVLSFDQPVTCIEDVPDGSLGTHCVNTLTEETMSALGVMPNCAWTADRRQLRIVLGGGATLAPGSDVTVKAGVLFNCNAGPSTPLAPMQTVAVLSNEPITPVVAVLTATPPRAQSCSSIVLSTTSSQGAALRPLETRWSFGEATHPAMQASLEATLRSANDEAASELRLSPRVFYAAVQSVRQATFGSEWATYLVQLEIQVNVTNWLGSIGYASAIVELDKQEGTQLPQIAPVGSTLLEVERHEQARFAVQTSFTPLTECDDSAAPEEQRQTVVSWKYLAPGEADWARMDDSAIGLTDLARQPNVVKFGAYTFEPGTTHLFLASAAFPGTPLTELVAPSVVFTLKVAPQGPPEANIQGPELLDSKCDFALNATRSRDPSKSPDEAGTLNVTWRCTPAAPGGPPCDGLENFLPEHVTRTDGYGAKGLMFLVTGGQLQPGMYVFSLAVGRANDPGGVPGMASLTVTVVDEGLNPTTVTVPWESGSKVSVQAVDGISGSARVQGSERCSIPEAREYRWALIEEEGEPMVVAQLPTQISRDSAGLEVEVATSGFRGNSLTPGSTYSYALLQAVNAEQMAAADEPALVASLLSAGLLVFRSSAFVADGAPSSGQATVAPVSGEALVTQFTVSTLGWYDEDVESLTYAFYRFPLEGAQYDVVDGVVVSTPAFVPPAIEWEDKTSDNFWLKLNGMPVRVWGNTPEVHGIAYPAGMYYVAVRARDTLGGTGVTAFLGPLVGKGSCSLSADAASSVVGDQLASNDAEQLMNSVDTVSQSMGCITSGKSESVNVAVGALEVAVSIMDTSPENIQKMGLVVQSMGEATGDELDEDTRQRAMDVVSAVISASLDGEGGGVAQEDGSALLGAVLSLGPSASGEVASADAEAASQATAEVLDQLGEAAVQALPLGGSQTLRNSAQGREVAMQLNKLDLSSVVTEGVTVPGLVVPASAMTTLSSRRLSESCNALTVQQTEWLRSNPYHWAPPTLGFNAFVQPNADVKVVGLRRCGVPLATNGTESPFQIGLPLAELPVPVGFEAIPRCGLFNESLQAWLTDDVSLKEPVDAEAGEVTCLATSGAGSFTAFLELVPLPSRTTWTPASMGDCARTALPLLPEGAGAWSCGQTVNDTAWICRAPCSIEGSALAEAAVRCVDGSWEQFSACPAAPMLGVDQSRRRDSTAVVVGSLSAVAVVLGFVGVAALVWRYHRGSAAVKPMKPEEAEPQPAASAPSECVAPLGSEAAFIEAEPSFWEWATMTMNAVTNMPSADPRAGEAITQIPAPPPLPQTSRWDPEPPADEPSTGLPDRRSFPVEVEADPDFWQWAHSQAETSPELIRPPTPSDNDLALAPALQTSPPGPSSSELPSGPPSLGPPREAPAAGAVADLQVEDPLLGALPDADGLPALPPEVGPLPWSVADLNLPPLGPPPSLALLNASAVPATPPLPPQETPGGTATLAMLQRPRPPKPPPLPPLPDEDSQPSTPPPMHTPPMLQGSDMNAEAAGTMAAIRAAFGGLPGRGEGVLQKLPSQQPIPFAPPADLPPLPRVASTQGPHKPPGPPGPPQGSPARSEAGMEPGPRGDLPAQPRSGAE